MEVTEENEKFILEAIRTPFLTEQWEKEMFVGALVSAAAWGKKVDEQNKKYFSRNHLIDKYNT